MKKFLSILAGFLCLFSLKTLLYAAPPANFQVQQLVTQGIDGPSGLGLAPDGRIFILERTGKVKIFKNGELLATPFVDLPSAGSGDRGLIGIAFDPQFSDNHYVYFYYTSATDLLNYLVRFNASGDVGTDGPTIIYQTHSPSNQLHVGGSIQFGPDGKLYFAVGDNGYPPNAQNLANPHGKILRINKDGTIPNDNPFAEQEGALPEIWAYGFRNPWRFQFDSANNNVYLSDVGNDAWEEINKLEKGKNYGWPICEGNCSNDSFVNPLYTYPHNGNSSSATGGPVYRATMFPEHYRGRYFFGDYAQGFIKTIGLDEQGNFHDIEDFDLSAGSIVDLKVAPDGSIYYINYYPGRLYRLSYAEGNQQPVAIASVDITKGLPPLTVNFSSAGSYDPDNTPLTYQWDFGDGTATDSAFPTKTYPNKGTYIVDMTVTDGTTSAQAVPLTIQVGTPPTVTIGQPADGTLYKAGDTINYTVHAIDGVGNDINDAAIQTEIIFHHHTHIHPFLGPITGRTGSFTTPTSGEAAADTWFEIRAKATDTNGLSTTTSVFLYPKVVTMTLLSNPSGLQLRLDGQPITTPYTFQSVVNFQREISAETPQVLGNYAYDFTSWSDEQSRTHTLTTPGTDTFITADFSQGQANYFQGEYYNSVDLSGTPVYTRADEAINFDWGDGSPDQSIHADLFSARWTKTDNFPAGVYTFSTTTDDGVRLIVDGNMVIDKWQNQSALTYAATVSLTEGSHTIVMEYYENAAGAVAKMSYEKIADLPPPQGFAAEYFTNQSLMGTPTVTKNEQAINFDWHGGSPDPQIPIDHFSARWKKTLSFETGTYKFSVTTDDGMRIFVDSTKIFDHWNDQSATYSFEYNLQEGNHEITVEYFENGGDAKAQVDWEKVDHPTDTGFTGQYYDNQTMSGLPVVVRNDATINFDWGNGSPDTSIPANHFSVRWTKHHTFTPGTYRFTTTSDDGIRLKIDGITYIEKWIDQSSKQYQTDVVLEGGEHTIVMEYYENGGGAVAKLHWEIIGDVPTTAIQAQYFGNLDLSGTAIITKQEDNIYFDWGNASPDTSVPVDNFSARYKKTEFFAGGDYRFVITADDGVRVSIDGAILLDKWKDQSPTTYTLFAPITAGTHTIVVEYYERGGGAVIKAQWTRVSGPSAQGFSATYFSNQFLAGLPAVTRIDPIINFSWGQNAPDTSLPTDHFSARWIKTVTLAGGDYRFQTKADDGIRLFVDDAIVIDQWNDQSSKSFTKDIHISDGDHTVRVEYYENGGDAVVEVNWEILP